MTKTLRKMTVGELKKFLADLDDEALVVVPASDHVYRLPRMYATTARYHRDHGITEDHGEAATPTETYGEAIPVVVVE